MDRGPEANQPDLEALTRQVRALEMRVGALERQIAGFPADWGQPEGVEAASSVSAVPSLGETVKLVPVAGKALLGIAGAYLLAGADGIRGTSFHGGRCGGNCLRAALARPGGAGAGPARGVARSDLGADSDAAAVGSDHAFPRHFHLDGGGRAGAVFRLRAGDFLAAQPVRDRLADDPGRPCGRGGPADRYLRSRAVYAGNPGHCGGGGILRLPRPLAARALDRCASPPMPPCCCSRIS